MAEMLEIFIRFESRRSISLTISQTGTRARSFKCSQLARCLWCSCALIFSIRCTWSTFNTDTTTSLVGTTTSTWICLFCIADMFLSRSYSWTLHVDLNSSPLIIAWMSSWISPFKRFSAEVSSSGDHASSFLAKYSRSSFASQLISIEFFPLFAYFKSSTDWLASISTRNALPAAPNNAQNSFTIVPFTSFSDVAVVILHLNFVPEFDATMRK